MEKEFVKYEIALELKELGFDEPCLGYYENNGKNNLLVTDSVNFTNTDLKVEGISSPLYQQVFRWFREKYRLDSKPEYFLNDWYCFIINDMKGTETSRRLFTEFPSYEEAELACIEKLIEIVKEKK